MRLKFYSDSKACVRMNGKLARWFVIDSRKARVSHVTMVV